MDWNTVRQALWDEMEKIAVSEECRKKEKTAETSLVGVSPETAQGLTRPMMETAGYDKARKILARAEMLKTSADRTKKPSLTPAQKRELATYVVAGAATGRLMAEMSFKKSVSPTRKTLGSLIGMTAATEDYRRQHLRPSSKRGKRKVGNVLTPGIALRTSQQVGRANRSLRALSPTTPR